MAAAMAVGALYNVISAGFIGSLHDSVLLAAVTFGLSLLGLVMAVGAVLGAIGLLLLNPLVSLLGADAAAAPATASYVAVFLAFVPVLAAAGAFFVVVFVFRDQLFSIFSSEHVLLGAGVTILTARLVAMIGNGFTGLITSLMQATARGTAAIVLSMTQGVLFIPIVVLGNLWFGLTGIIWALTVTEALMLVAALVLWLINQRAVVRGLAEGSQERAERALEMAEADRPVVNMPEIRGVHRGTRPGARRSPACSVAPCQPPCALDR
jgi:Na+-driven multidrug efflux pump